MWDFFETVRHRHSVRKFISERKVEPEKLHAILEMASAAPSAGDLQAYQILVVTSQEHKSTLAKAASNQAFISQAPVCLIFCSDATRSEAQFGSRGKTLYAIQDATIAAAYAQLAIVAAGMASTWIGYFDESQISLALNIEPHLTPVAIISLGYPAELPEPTTRRHLEDVVKYC